MVKGYCKDNNLKLINFQRYSPTVVDGLRERVNVVVDPWSLANIKIVLFANT